MECRVCDHSLRESQEKPDSSLPTRPSESLSFVIVRDAVLKSKSGINLGKTHNMTLDVYMCIHTLFPHTLKRGKKNLYSL